jgi:diguanylate cyclase (GGDEF)-like protein
MTRLINSVAHLTDLRDRDELELTLASVLFDLIGPVKLTIWRIVGHAGNLRLRRRVEVLSGNRIIPCDPRTGFEDLPLPESEMGLRACYASKTPVKIKAGEDGQRSHVYPVTSANRVIGLLEIRAATALREYQERLVLGLLRIYRNHVGVLDDIERDELTGLLNRKTFDDHFRTLTAQNGQPIPQFAVAGDRRTESSRQPAWLAVLDIDRFKRINDDFGHLYGDEILVLLARLMRSTFRDADRLFRFGGEEFVAVFRPEPHSVTGVLERCRTAIEEYQFPQVGRVTVSIGYTKVAGSDAGSDAFGRADKALYFAKQNGRNQVQSYEILVDRGVLLAKEVNHSEVELF